MKYRAAISLLVMALSAGVIIWFFRPDSPPSIVLITIDTLRADRVGVYGNTDGLTPRIDKLAAGGLVFDRAMAPMGITWPSHTTMLTGLYPRYHGVRSNKHRLDDDQMTVTQRLQDAGYDTASFVSFKGMHYLLGLGRGFEVVSDPGRTPGKAIRDGRETTDMALNWLDERYEQGREQPLFLWLHLFEPHGPYELTDYARQKFAASDYQGPFANGTAMDFLNRQLRPETESDLTAMRTLYDGEVALADRYVGEVLDRLSEQGVLDNSVVIFTADHGQGLGENGRMGHGPVLWTQILHVPLIVRDFRTDHPGRVDQVVGLVDIAPTISAISKTPSLAASQGRDLSQLLYGGTGPSQDYFAEVTLSEEPLGDWYSPDAVAVFSDGLKFLPRRSLDPLDPISDDPVAYSQSDRPAVLSTYVAGLYDEFVAGQALVQQASLQESDIEALRSMGYIQ